MFIHIGAMNPDVPVICRLRTECIHPAPPHFDASENRYYFVGQSFLSRFTLC